MKSRVDRWLLEHDNEGEVYTRPRVDKALIQEVLASFDNAKVFYACLCDNTDESCLWCYGEASRRIIEGRFWQNREGGFFHFILSKQRRKPGQGNAPVTVRYGLRGDEILEVDPRELLTVADAVAAFHAFYDGTTIPRGLEAVANGYLFRSMTLKEVPRDPNDRRLHAR